MPQQGDALGGLLSELSKIESDHEDPLGVALDFESFCVQFESAAETFALTKERFSAQQILMVASCGALSSDRQIQDYLGSVWHSESVAIPKGAPPQEILQFPVPML